MTTPSTTPNLFTGLDVVHGEGRVASGGGETIYWQHGLPRNPRAVLLFVHGLAEHSNRYGFPVRYFAPRGYACWALDLRGHGRSSGKRVHVDSFDDYAADVTAVLDVARSVHGDLPVCLVGHSMGGLVSLRYALHHGDQLAGAILSSPALGTHPDLQPSRFLRVTASLVARLAPRTLFPTHLNVDHISRSPEVVAAYRDDPLVTCKVSAGWFAAIEEAMADVRDRSGDLSLQTLMMQSGADALVDPDATRRWAGQAPAARLEFVEWPGFFHEMFNEPERLDVFRRMDAWLDRLLGASSGPSSDAAAAGAALAPEVSP